MFRGPDQLASRAGCGPRAASWTTLIKIVCITFISVIQASVRTPTLWLTAFRNSVSWSTGSNQTWPSMTWCMFHSKAPSSLAFLCSSHWCQRPHPLYNPRKLDGIQLRYGICLLKCRNLVRHFQDLHSSPLAIWCDIFQSCIFSTANCPIIMLPRLRAIIILQ